MAKKTKVRFARDEARHIPIGTILADEVYKDGSIRKLTDSWVDEDTQRLLQLAESYGIQYDQSMENPEKGLALFFKNLALELARELYPERKRLQTKKWTDIVIAVFIVEMERLIEPNNSHKGASWAALQLSKQERWKEFVRGGGDSEKVTSLNDYLRERYQNCKKKAKPYMVETVQGSYNYHDHLGTLEDWEDMVDDILSNPTGLPPQ